jgi:hypothetical protein
VVSQKRARSEEQSRQQSDKVEWLRVHGIPPKQR